MSNGRRVGSTPAAEAAARVVVSVQCARDHAGIALEAQIRAAAARPARRRPTRCRPASSRVCSMPPTTGKQVAVRSASASSGSRLHAGGSSLSGAIELHAGLRSVMHGGWLDSAAAQVLLEDDRCRARVEIIGAVRTRLRGRVALVDFVHRQAEAALQFAFRSGAPRAVLTCAVPSGWKRQRRSPAHRGATPRPGGRLPRKRAAPCTAMVVKGSACPGERIAAGHADAAQAEVECEKGTGLQGNGNLREGRQRRPSRVPPHRR